MSKATVLTSIPIELPRRQILSRLGHRPETVLSQDQQAFFEQNLQIAFQQIVAKGAFTYRTIVQNDGKVVSLTDSTQISCPPVAKMVQGCDELWIGAATVGNGISHITAELCASNQTAAATICDATGSECADATMDFLQNYAAMQLKSTGRLLTNCRFSPGFGGWNLSAQKLFFQWLPLDSLDMALTETLLLQPEKSVTAIAGVKRFQRSGEFVVSEGTEKGRTRFPNPPFPI